MKTKLFKLTTALFICGIFFSQIGTANNLVVSSGDREGSNLDSITFSIAWENSWYVSGLPANHDAVWVFIKYRECGVPGQWSHALLDTVISSHYLHANLGFVRDSLFGREDRLGVVCEQYNNTGCLIRRAALGIGDISTSTMGLKIIGGLDTDGNLETFDSGEEYEIKIFGIEMVQIKEGTFSVGDGSSTYTLRKTNALNEPVSVNNENTSTFVVSNGLSEVTMQTAYPKGYAEFYCMKYEISQGQYCDFLNTIPNAASRYCSSYDITYMNFVTTGNDGYTAGDNADRAMNYMNANDLLTYLDWACLRPMTELEYEKACRGAGTVLAGEFAWGGTVAVEALNATGATSAGTETIDESGANLNYTGADTEIQAGLFQNKRGPVACGVFAREGNETRETSGATYYGVMEMSGNVWELCVSFNKNDNTTSSDYTGVWGDGIIDASTGKYNQADWPVGTDDDYLIQRGGTYYGANTVGSLSSCSVSDRYCDQLDGQINTDAEYSLATRWAAGHGWIYEAVGGRGVR